MVRSLTNLVSGHTNGATCLVLVSSRLRELLITHTISNVPVYIFLKIRINLFLGKKVSGEKA